MVEGVEPTVEVSEFSPRHFEICLTFKLAPGAMGRMT